MNISTKKMLACSSLAVSLLASCAVTADATPVSISTTGKNSVTFVVNNLANATGFGGHFSTGNEDGYGGYNAECHFIAGTTPTSGITFYCYDGYQSDAQHVNNFRLDIGPKFAAGPNGSSVPNVSHAVITVSRRGVQVDVTKIATSGFTTEKIPYTISSFIPLRESSGFFRGSTIWYETNGVINARSDRPGQNYQLAAPVTR